MLTPARAEVLLGLPVTGSRWQTVITMTPEKAKIILDGQHRQRPINQTNLTKLKTAITSGRWNRTHQGIAFDQDGILSDGQHRLQACVETAHPIELLACFNEPRELFPAYDGGVVRGIWTHLVLGGVVETATIAGTVAPAAKFIWAYDQGANPTSLTRINGWGYETVCAVLAAHPGIPAVVDEIRQRRPRHFPLSTTAAIFTLMREASPEKSATFIRQILTGESLQQGDPAHTLREVVMRGGVTPVDTAYRIVRAWNAFYEGRRLLKIYGRTAANGTKARLIDVFPEIAGYKRPGQERAA